MKNNDFERELINITVRHDLHAFTRAVFHMLAPTQKFQDNWHLHAIAWHLQLCAVGRIKRLLINVPPRHLKSLCASVAFVAWLLGHDPTARIICASYSEELASKHARDCREVMRSRIFRESFPTTRIGRTKNTELDFVTSHHGYRYSTSVGGTLTGRGGNFIIIDDPIKPEDAMSDLRRTAVNDWYDRTLYSRLDSKRDDVIILVMQRLHMEDLAGYVQTKEPWTVLNVPATAEVDERIAIGPDQFHERKAGELLHPAREPQEALDKLKAALGPFNYAAQYQQNPIPVEGAIIKWSWFNFFDVLTGKNSDYTRYQSWDTAFTDGKSSDYSVCTTWYVRGTDYYLVDVFREKLTYPDLKQKIVERALGFEAIPIIEEKGSGIDLIRDLRRTSIVKPIAFKPEGDKLSRIHTQSAKIAAGHVHLRANMRWLAELKKELLQFPHSRHDDQVDSISQFLAWIEERQTHRTIVMSLHEFGIG